MLYKEIDDVSKRALRDYLISQRVNLFVGSGVSSDSFGKQGLMLLAGDLRERLIAVNNLPDQTSLQLAYSALTEEQVAKEITARYSCTQTGGTIERLARHPWKRVYTLNVDNAFEESFRAYMTLRSFEGDSLETGIFNDDYFDQRPETRCSIIHLHGSVEKPERGYVFSNAEYAKQMTRPNPWMMVLVGLMRTETFIVAGTTLEEMDVTYYLEQRSSKSIRSDVPPSVLIEPNPNRLTEMLCQKHEFCLFIGTPLEFFQTLEKQTNGESDFWTDYTNDGLSALHLGRAKRLHFSTTFEHVPIHPTPEGDPMRFLLGAELKWYMLSKGADIARDVYAEVRNKTLNFIKNTDVRVLLISDKPGTGKTSLLRRLAFDLRHNFQNVFFYTGQFYQDPTHAAEIIDKLQGDCIIFVDNWADALSNFSLLLPKIVKRNILFVCAERDYRTSYIDASFSIENFDHIDGILNPTQKEINKLLSSHTKHGLSTISEGDMAQVSKLKSDEPIAVACCRIQNNFKRFDNIVDELLKECDQHEKLAYTTIALARYCTARGIHRRILSTISYFDAVEHLFSNSSSLPVKYSDANAVYVVPQQTVVGETVLRLAASRNRSELATIFADLVNALGPMVNPRTIRERKPEALLIGRLMDFDSIVKRFIDAYAEQFYEQVKTGAEWNSRYWEQLSLLKLDRFLASPEDSFLLQESLQHARSALTRESHPFSHTTLAKVLFQAMRAVPTSKEEYFDEAWSNVEIANRIESKWTSRGAALFVVAFTGAHDFVELGGILSGEQSDRLRDMRSTTYALSLRDHNLVAARDAIGGM